ncbi:Trip11p [Blomia tropicalis]|nr:Trip11p [Blomia tropicalis]
MVDLEASYEGKIDKQIVKSLLISYFATAPGTVARTEGERLLARFLDFNQQEMDRAGIKIGKSRKNQGGGGGNDSFTSMFVEFLETESNQGKEDVQSNKDRKLSTSSAHSFTNQASIELARDLNKRMNQSGSSSTTTSSTSSTSMEHSTNQLFSGSQTAPIPPVYLGTTSGRKASSSGTSNIVDIKYPF